MSTPTIAGCDVREKPVKNEALVTEGWVPSVVTSPSARVLLQKECVESVDEEAVRRVFSVRRLDTH